MDLEKLARECVEALEQNEKAAHGRHIKSRVLIVKDALQAAVDAERLHTIRRLAEVTDEIKETIR
jgi:hypothetical protein